MHVIKLCPPTTDFDGWRRRGATAGARRACRAGRCHVDGRRRRPAGLFDGETRRDRAARRPALQRAARVRRARRASAFCHRDPERFALLYRLLWRLQASAACSTIAADPLTSPSVEAMAKAVRRDIHKMHAFVRFREIATRGRPALRRLVRAGAPHRRGGRAVLRRPLRGDALVDPDAGALRALGRRDCSSSAPASPKRDAPREDALEDLWRAYYATIFNPARLKVAAMQSGDAEEILAEPAGGGAHSGADRQGRAADARRWSRPSRRCRSAARQRRRPPATSAGPLRRRHASRRCAREAADCRACPLWRDATQTVFGEGPPDADVMFVGEQPGDQEDLAGRPFVGPAGQLFDQALDEAGIDREATYVTNAVKHFKFEPRGKCALHKKPNAREIAPAAGG